MKDKYLLLDKVHSSATYVCYFISGPFISLSSSSHQNKEFIFIKLLLLHSYVCLIFWNFGFFLRDGKQFLPSATWWAVPKLKLGCFAVSLDLKINLIFKNFY